MFFLSQFLNVSDCMSTTQVRKTNRKTRSLFVSEPFTNSTHTKKGRTEETTRQVTRTEGERERAADVFFHNSQGRNIQQAFTLLQSPHEQRGGHMAGGRQTPLMPGGRKDRERERESARMHVCTHRNKL